MLNSKTLTTVLEIKVKCFKYISYPGANLQMSNLIQSSSQLPIRTFKFVKWGKKNLMMIIQISKHVTDSLQDDSFQIGSFWCIWLVYMHLMWYLGLSEKYKGISDHTKISYLNYIKGTLHLDITTFLFTYYKI